MAALFTVALGVEYDGGAFHGFQRQSHAASVQETLEQAIGRVADEPLRIVAAGRTDAGVHATQQVVSFDTRAERSERAWRRGVSSLTPDAVQVVWAKVLDPGFHARFDATARRYVYVFSDARQKPAIHRGLVAWWRGNALDASAMHRAAQCLVGEHDFSAFRAAACQSKTPHRNIASIRVERINGYVAIDVVANAFLLHMVRNIATALAYVGAGSLSAEGLRELLARRNRALAPPTAAPQGLYLVGVDYPQLPLSVRPPPLLSSPATETTALQPISGLS